MKRSEHPKSCRVCNGTGWAETVTSPISGRPLFTPCPHHWTDDEPRPEEHLAADHPRAIAAFARGYAAGLADLEAMRQEHR